MARWSAFLEPAWNDVKGCRRKQDYESLKEMLARMADEAAGR